MLLIINAAFAGFRQIVIGSYPGVSSMTFQCYCCSMLTCACTCAGVAGIAGPDTPHAGTGPAPAHHRSRAVSGSRKTPELATLNDRLAAVRAAAAKSTCVGSSADGGGCSSGCRASGSCRRLSVPAGALFQSEQKLRALVRVAAAHSI